MATTVVELVWLTTLLWDLVIRLPTPPQLLCDSLSALYLTINPVIHACIKHVEIDYLFRLGESCTRLFHHQACLCN